MKNKTERKLLILDIDETLVYSTVKPLTKVEDFKADQYYVYKRPGLDLFLDFCLDNYDLAVWTSSASEYAKIIVNNLFSRPDYLEFVWSREKCTQRYNLDTNDYYLLKDLKKVKKMGFDLDAIIMIDDSKEKLERNYGNHISVAPYRGELNDDELAFLQKYLISLKDISNIRKVEKRGWKQLFKNEDFM
jgi:TFIIF-interacting CTD phosphatase-like protein